MIDVNAVWASMGPYKARHGSGDPFLTPSRVPLFSLMINEILQSLLKGLLLVMCFLFVLIIISAVLGVIFDIRDRHPRGNGRRLRHMQNSEEVTEESFASDPDAARQQYALLRNEHWATAVKRKLKSLRKQKADLDTSLRKLGERIKQNQQAKNRVQAELQEMESIDLSSVTKFSQERLDAEFERLLKLPGVAGVRCDGNEISLLVKARFKHEGTLYDLGDWNLRFGDGFKLKSTELRSGVRPGWTPGVHPAYRLHRGFCFGNRLKTINDNLHKGQYLEAIELAVNCLQTINPEDLYLVSSAFMPAATPEELPKGATT